MQLYERDKFPYLPIHCFLCGQLVVLEIGDAPPQLKPCAHTLFIGTSEGFEFLAERAIRQLRQRGFEVQEYPLDVMPPKDDDDSSSRHIVDQLEFPDALQISSSDPVPFGVDLYVGFAPRENEGGAMPAKPTPKPSGKRTRKRTPKSEPKVRGVEQTIIWQP